MTVSDVVDDLSSFIRRLRAMNEGVRIVLTVSPVPLVATATGKHVLPATVYSKSVLRVAAEEIVRSHTGVTYFPAYEIVTGPQAPEGFYQSDRRNVSDVAVQAVMGALLANAEVADAKVPTAATEDPAAQAISLSQFVVEVECEEMMSDHR